MVKKLYGNFGYVKSFRSFAPDMTEIETSERIRQKAHELFMQYGLRSVSMDDIANGLGISKKTIYQSYADKDALVDAVVKVIIGHNQEYCDIDRRTSDNAVHEIFLAMEFMMEIFRSMNASLLFDMQKYHPNAFLQFSKHKNDYLYGVIKDNLIRGVKEELYRPEIKIEILARFRVESVSLPFNPEFHTKLKASLAEIEEEMTYNFLFGLVSQKGYKLILKYQQERTKKELQ
ncbi:MAG TPA: TetR/AcrR family transcriptional regulator [Ferruginibacter sp.]|nr:TetR/AcrR family transcriptional regulator [Ferruginibacter sp.]